MSFCVDIFCAENAGTFQFRGYYFDSTHFLSVPNYETEHPDVLNLVVHSSFGGLEVSCWPLIPKFAGLHPAEAVGFFRAKKSLARLPSGGEVKPSVPRRSFTAREKKTLNVTCNSAFRQNYLTFLGSQFHLLPLGALAWRHAWRCLVVKVGTSNPDRTISLKAAVSS